MASKRSPQDEKLIRDLYEKLNWFTFQASEEEFDAEQVRAILRLLDTLDPMPEIDLNSSPEENKRVTASDPDAAFERFKKKYNITEEDLAKKDAGSAAAGSDPEDGKILPFPMEASEELVPDTEKVREKRADADCNLDKRRGKKKHAGKNGHKHFFSGVLGKVAAGVLIVAGTTTFLSIGTSAVQQKSFFEIVRDGVNSMKITVTGNDMETESQSEPVLSLESEEKVYFNSWDEVKEDNPDILVPGYIPEGLELEELYSQNMGDYVHYVAFYSENNLTERMTIGVRSFTNDYSERNFNVNSDWSFMEEKEGVLFYESGVNVQAIFNNHKEMYYIIWKNKKEIIDMIDTMK